MAKAIENFITNTRMASCYNSKCKFNVRIPHVGSSMHSQPQCAFKTIEIDYNGKCLQFEKIEEE